MCRCKFDRDNWTRQPGWADVVVTIGTDPFTGAQLLPNITGIRYGVSHDHTVSESAWVPTSAIHR